MKVSIDKNVPLPTRKTILPFAQMEVGDSFLVPAGIPAGYARVLIHSFQQENAARFSLLKTEQGYRCWRVK